MPRFAVYLVLLILFACETVIPEPPTAEVVVEGDRYFIVDQDGKHWDVTHAVRAYRMRPENFQFGLGVNAIRPIINPQIALPGESGYPAPDDPRIVIGTTINGESRAYATDPLNSHEVVDETFGDVYVAVGW